MRLIGEPSELNALMDELDATPGVVIRRRGRKASRDDDGKDIQYAEIRVATPAGATTAHGGAQ